MAHVLNPQDQKVSAEFPAVSTPSGSLTHGHPPKIVVPDKAVMDDTLFSPGIDTPGHKYAAVRGSQITLLEQEHDSPAPANKGKGCFNMCFKPAK